jgi:hypothetical protein
MPPPDRILAGTAGENRAAIVERKTVFVYEGTQPKDSRYAEEGTYL